MRALLPLVGLFAVASAAAAPLPSIPDAAGADAAAMVLRLEPYRRTVAVRVEANGTRGLMAFDTAVSPDALTRPASGMEMNPLLST